MSWKPLDPDHAGVLVQHGLIRPDHGPDMADVACDNCGYQLVDIPGLDCPRCIEKIGSEPYDGEADQPSSWDAVDLTDALNGIKSPPADVLERADGKHLFYSGRLSWVLGEPESMKSWIAQLAAYQVLAAGGDVLYVDYEDQEGGVVERLLGLGTPADKIRDHLVYVRPEVPVGNQHRQAVTQAELRLRAHLDARPWRLAILDGVTESMAVEGLDPNDNAAVADWLGRIPRRLANTGAAAVCIDHVTKNIDGRGRYAIGAQHKLAAVDGVALAVEVVHPLSRADLEPVTGKARLKVGKDRPGWVRSICEEAKLAGTLEITAWPDGKLSADIVAETIELAPPFEVISNVLKVLDTYGGEDTETHLFKHADFTEAECISAIKWLLDKDWVRADKRGNSTLYVLTDKGRRESDPE